MSFERTRYDPCEAKQAINESARAASYNINTPVLCGRCLPTDPHIVAQKTGASLNSGLDQRFYSGPIDVESDLFGVNRRLGTCNTDKYAPRCPDCGNLHEGAPCGQGVVSSCMSQELPAGGLPLGIERGMNEFASFSMGSAPAGMRKPGQRCGDNNLIDYPTCFFGVEDTRLSNPPQNLKGVGVNRFVPLLLPAQEQIVFPGEMMIPSRTVMKDNHRPCVPSLKTISEPFMPEAQPLPQIPCGPTTAVYTSPLYQYDVCG